MFLVRELRTVDRDHYDLVVEGGGPLEGLRFSATYTRTSHRLILGKTLERGAGPIAIGLPDETFDRLEIEIVRAIEKQAHHAPGVLD